MSTMEHDGSFGRITLAELRDLTDRGDVDTIMCAAPDPYGRLVGKRFTGKMIGWIRYKPLMVYITQRDEYEEIIKAMREKLELTIPKLCRYFNNNHFENILPELAHYHKNVRKHFAAFEATKTAWGKVMKKIDSAEAIPAIQRG